MLGISTNKEKRFIKNFMIGANSIQNAVKNYIDEVKAGEFPGPEHEF